MGARLGIPRTVSSFAALKWHLLLGGLRGSVQQRIQTVLSVVVSLAFGVLGGLVLAAVGRSSDLAEQIVIILLPVTVMGLGILSAATGVEATIDPRHLATEPLTRWELSIGLLASAVVGPAALLAALVGVGIWIGWGMGFGAVAAALAVAIVVCWWVTLLLVSRATANALGAFASGRFRQVAQFVASGAALVVWLVAQVLVRRTEGWTTARWDRLADLAAWTPPGQLGRALATIDEPATAVQHLVAGVGWLPLLLWVSVLSTVRLTYSPPRPVGGPARGRRRPAGLRSGVLGILPAGPVGATAARTLTTKVRTPRQAVNTLTALLVGAGVFLLGPVIDGGTPDPRLVLVGGLLHFAVLFDGNNAFGMDGPALWVEVTSGARASVLVRAKVLSSFTVMGLPALILPVSLAVYTGGWAWVPAAWLLALGSLLAAAGVSVASASLAPVALPDSPNPLAAGDTGQGCVAGMMLAGGMLVLLIASAPVAVLVALAAVRSAGLATAASLLAPVVGFLVLWGCFSVARSRLDGREAELIQNVTPAR